MKPEDWEGRFFALAHEAGFEVEGPLKLPPEVFTWRTQRGKEEMKLTERVQVILLQLAEEGGGGSRSGSGDAKL